MGCANMVDKQSPIPYYLQIYNILKDRIDKGVYEANSQLPSENELVAEFDVTRVTIRNAVKKLKDEGRIYTVKAKGSYINGPKIEQSLFNFYSFGRNYTNFNIESVVVSIAEEVASEDLRGKLYLDEGDIVTVIVRIRKLEGTPVIVETSYIPKKIAPGIGGLNLGKLSIYNILENEYNKKIAYAREYLDPSVTDEYYSKLLKVRKGTPVFITERITYTIDEKPIEYRISTIRSDKFRFSVELR
jgi:GntR family transcriptional regulator